MDPQDHVTLCVTDGRIWVCHEVIENKAPNSASAADAIMLRSILHTTYAMPFSVGSKLAGWCGDRFFSLKKCMPPALLRDFGQDK